MRNRNQTAINEGMEVRAIAIGSKKKLPFENPNACAMPNKKHENTAPKPIYTENSLPPGECLIEREKPANRQDCLRRTCSERSFEIIRVHLVRLGEP